MVLLARGSLDNRCARGRCFARRGYLHQTCSGPLLCTLCQESCHRRVQRLRPNFLEGRAIRQLSRPAADEQPLRVRVGNELDADRYVALAACARNAAVSGAWLMLLCRHEGILYSSRVGAVRIRRVPESMAPAVSARTSTARRRIARQHHCMAAWTHSRGPQDLALPWPATANQSLSTDSVLCCCTFAAVRWVAKGPKKGLRVSALKHRHADVSNFIRLLQELVDTVLLFDGIVMSKHHLRHLLKLLGGLLRDFHLRQCLFREIPRHFLHIRISGASTTGSSMRYKHKLPCVDQPYLATWIAHQIKLTRDKFQPAVVSQMLGYEDRHS
mmetsp:Transcript_139616/g.256949  ORF Transcript_139616/g.256949 Transcript_139616/m.256949 type:complete len:328 (-) Transcript_139616:232-1215(-)